MQKKKIACIIGTRPELLKLAPVVTALEALAYVDVSVIFTAQHREMLDQLKDILPLPVVADLNVMKEGQTVTELSIRILEKLTPALDEISPDFLLMQGDTTTTLLAALAGFYRKIPVGYVESGLRTYNPYRPFPEEMNRRLATQLSTLHFAPTEHSRKNLRAEGVNGDRIFVTGNPILDTVDLFLSKNIKPRFDSDKKVILVTCHRRESFGEPLRHVVSAIETIAQTHEDCDIVFPVHPNPHVKDSLGPLQSIKNVFLTDPMPYPEFLAQLKSCFLVMTDSGGVQEEAPYLGKPLLIMRTETERPEAITTGNSMLVGLETTGIVSAVNQLLNDPGLYESMSHRSAIFGDGTAGKRIATIVDFWLENKTRSQR